MRHDTHGHHANYGSDLGDSLITWAIAVNLLLTAAQIIGGILSGSLALIADALPNFSDAIALIIAFAARKIARRPADEVMSFGYGRVEVVAALPAIPHLRLLFVRVKRPRPILHHKHSIFP